MQLAEVADEVGAGAKLGGAAGMFIRADELGMKMTFEDTRAAKATLGWPHTGYKRFDQALWIMGQALKGELSSSMRRRIGSPPRGLKRS